MTEKTKDKFIEKILEQESKKLFWGNIFKSLVLLYFVIGSAFIYAVYTDLSLEFFKEKSTEKEHLSVIRLEGSIDSGDAFFQKYKGSIKYAFENEKSKAVVLNINSPGGSPVQSSKLYNWIKTLKEKHKKPVVAVLEDIAASGGYYIALAADEIHANSSSIVGSIGVIMTTYNISETAQKLGVKKNNLVTGEHKDIGDPFKGVSPQQEELLMESINDIFEEFKGAVIESRGSKIDKSDNEIFSGRFWSGKKAQKVGLVDGFETLESLKKKYAVEKALLYNPESKPLLNKLFGVDIMAQEVIRSLKNETQTFELK